MQVTKRNGTTEPLNVDKIHEMLVAARDAGNKKLNVSVSKVAIKAKIQFLMESKPLTFIICVSEPPKS